VETLAAAMLAEPDIDMELIESVVIELDVEDWAVARAARVERMRSFILVGGRWFSLVVTGAKMDGVLLVFKGDQERKCRDEGSNE